jgi:hypothetical protein
VARLDPLHGSVLEQVGAEHRLSAPADAPAAPVRQQRDADLPAERRGAVGALPVRDQAGRPAARLRSRRHVHDQPAVVLAEIAVGVEPALDGARVAEPGPVQADQARLGDEAAEHAEVGLGDGPQPDLR